MFKKNLILISFVLFLFLSYSYSQDRPDRVRPYMLKAKTPVVIDGDLSEWNFCFPFDMNLESIPEIYVGADGTELPATLRTADDDDDLSGTIMLMWDEENLYIAAKVRDDVPGMAPTIDNWASDAIEFYIGNYDLGDSPHAPDDEGHANGAYYDDPETGRLDCHFQLNVSQDPEDVYFVWYQPWEGNQTYPDSQAVVFPDDYVKVSYWDNGEGYNVEAKIPWSDIVGPKGTEFGVPEEDMVLPFTCGLFDVDTDDPEKAGEDFQALRYGAYHPGWQGVQNWPIAIQVVDAVDSTVAYGRPYALRRKANFVLDGDLSEWNFCFPFDMNLESIPEMYGDLPATLRTAEDNDDLSGTFNFMWDEENLYIAARVRDDVPGMAPTIDNWASDAIEFYIGNYDLGDSPHAPDDEGHANGAYYDDPETGRIDCHFQLNVNQEPEDVYFVWYQPWEGNQVYPDSQAVVFPDDYVKVSYWDNGEGYNVEAKIPWSDIVGPKGTEFGVPEEDMVLPFTCGLFDVDTDDPEKAGEDFQALRYGAYHPGWQGVHHWPIALTMFDPDLKYFPCHINGIDNSPTSVNENNTDSFVKRTNFISSYPNPFNSEAFIKFNLEKSTRVLIDVFDITGKKVRTLVNNKLYPAGLHKVKFNGGNLPSGIYFYRVKTDYKSEVSKMTLLK